MAQAFEITTCGLDRLSQYASIPIKFVCDSRLELELVEGGLGGIRLVEQPVIPPVEKDADALEGPLNWPKEFDKELDMDHFQMWMAMAGERPLGGAALFWNTPRVNMLDGRKDLSVLWDLRVHPDARGQGIGRALFRQAAEFSRGLGMAQMKIETQNNNVRANHFYHAMGARLGVIDRYAYVTIPEVADEVMMLWFLDL